MRVESPFFEKSSAHFILTRAKGLGILTFNKIRKTLKLVFFLALHTKITKESYHFNKIGNTSKNPFKKFCYGTLS